MNQESPLLLLAICSSFIVTIPRSSLNFLKNAWVSFGELLIVLQISLLHLVHHIFACYEIALLDILFVCLDAFPVLFHEQGHFLRHSVLESFLYLFMNFLSLLGLLL
jgi:hypothetical protein